MIVDIERLPHVYPPRRQFAYVIVREPDSFVLFKAYSDNHGTVRLAEFKSGEEVEEFVSGLPGARRVWL
jgi:hypothetical protein